ncbi:hypothetical protein V8G54_035202 [Vigna mungo]|uniref:Integrase zinc-binding domain-containing protein n=1 Tax=Vigna mungo TaxID=3915 RepID=A0AAQ3RAF7_VIGMU
MNCYRRLSNRFRWRWWRLLTDFWASGFSVLGLDPKLMQKRECEHVVEMQKLRHAIEDLKENMTHGGANSNNVNDHFRIYGVSSEDLLDCFISGLKPNIRREHKVVVPRDDGIIQLLLKEYHSSTLGGHDGITRTMAQLSSRFYWPDMLKDIT